jgi:hypothetical protein
MASPHIDPSLFDGELDTAHIPRRHEPQHLAVQLGISHGRIMPPTAPQGTYLPTENPEAPDFLTGVEPDAEGSIGQDCLRLRRERGGTGLVVVTGALDTADLPAIAGLRQRFQRLVVVSITTEPVTPFQFPGVKIITATSGEEVCNAWNLEVTG